MGGRTQTRRGGPAIAGRPAGRVRGVWRVARWVVLLGTVLIVVAGAWAVHGTGYERQALRHLSAAHPERSAAAWSRPCWRPNPAPYPGTYTAACARVSGRVLYRQQRDPDGDGDSHLLVVAGPHLVNLKFPLAAGRLPLPGPGGRIAVTGLLRNGRFGIPEVLVLRIG
jgi:hypothetical protein